MKPFQLANPTRLLRFTEQYCPLVGGLAMVMLCISLCFALILSPPDYQQGEAVRIMYIHVASAFMGMGIYVMMAVASAVFLIWRHQTAFIMARACAPVGAGFTLACMVTGAIWGKPMWGAWWVWDARLTSVLVLFFLYIGYMALGDRFDYSERTAKACSILALVGVANIPVIHFSVEWWNTLHQPSSLMRSNGVAIHDPLMLTALLSMACAFALAAAWMIAIRLQTVLILLKKRREVA